MILGQGPYRIYQLPLFDEREVIPAIAQTGGQEVLMLAYMNDEALARTRRMQGSLLVRSRDKSAEGRVLGALSTGEGDKGGLHEMPYFLIEQESLPHRL